MSPHWTFKLKGNTESPDSWQAPHWWAILPGFDPSWFPPLLRPWPVFYDTVRSSCLSAFASLVSNMGNHRVPWHNKQYKERTSLKSAFPPRRNSPWIQDGWSPNQLRMSSSMFKASRLKLRWIHGKCSRIVTRPRSYLLGGFKQYRRANTCGRSQLPLECQDLPNDMIKLHRKSDRVHTSVVDKSQESNTTLYTWLHRSKVYNLN